MPLKILVFGGKKREKYQGCGKGDGGRGTGDVGRGTWDGVGVGVGVGLGDYF